MGAITNFASRTACWNASMRHLLVAGTHRASNHGRQGTESFVPSSNVNRAAGVAAQEEIVDESRTTKGIDPSVPHS